MKTNCVPCVVGMELLYVITYDIHILQIAVPWLGVLDTKISPHRPVVDKRSFRVEFMETNDTDISIQTPRFQCQSTNFPQSSSSSYYF
jgi:hypothetical protein